MDANQAYDEMDAVLGAAQQVIGGSWKRQDDGAEICTTSSGTQGAVFPLLRIGPGVPADQQAAVFAAVSEKWAAAGFAPTVMASDTVGGVEVRELRYPETGYGTDGVYLSLHLSVKGSSAEGQTRCIPGDADTINQERQKQG